MKKIIIAASILFLAGACSNRQTVVTYPNQPSQPSNVATSTPDQTTGWSTYKSPDQYGFSLKYPSDFGFSTSIGQVQSLALSYIPVCDDNMVACAFLPKTNYPGTNFDGAGLSINIYPKLTNEADCYNFTVSTNAAQKPGDDANINGLVFKTASGGDAGAGHFDDVKVYRNFHNSQCYEISTHIGSTNIDNYPKGTVNQFNEDEVWQKLQALLNTFRFSNNAADFKTFNSAEEWGAGFSFTYKYPSSWYMQNHCNDKACAAVFTDFQEQFKPDPAYPNISNPVPAPLEHCELTISSGSQIEPVLENTYKSTQARSQCSSFLNSIKASYLVN